MPSARDSTIILVRPRGAICGHPRLVGRWPLLRNGPSGSEFFQRRSADGDCYGVHTAAASLTRSRKLGLPVAGPRERRRVGRIRGGAVIPSDQVAVTTTIGGWFPEKYWIRLSVPSSNSVWKRSPPGLPGKPVGSVGSVAAADCLCAASTCGWFGVASARMLDPSTAAASSVPIERGRRAERDTRISPFPISLWRAYPPSDLTERVGKGVDRNRFFEPPGRLTEPGSVPIVGLGARAAAPEGGKTWGTKRTSRPRA